MEESRRHTKAKNCNLDFVPFAELLIFTEHLQFVIPATGSYKRKESYRMREQVFEQGTVNLATRITSFVKIPSIAAWRLLSLAVPADFSSTVYFVAKNKLTT